MRAIKIYLSLFVLITISSNCTAQNETNNNSLKKIFENLPFEMEKLSIPNFPDNSFLLTDFGAVGDGVTLNTEAFAKAINECSDKGGGKIIVPKGIWLTGPIHLKSYINLHLESGAHIQFTRNFDDYPLIESNWEGYEQFRCTSPIMGRNLTNIAITGSGIIDGAGDAWRYVKKSKLTNGEWKDLLKSGGVVDESGNNWWPTAEARDAVELLAQLKKENKKITREHAEKHKVFFRPVLLSFINCKNIWLEGVTFQNSPAWNIHPLLCENVILTNINVRNPWYSQNGDGVDIESCKNVLIYNCKFDVGDDAMCMKSGRDKEGRDRGIPTENVLIQDCVVYHGHGGFTIGSEMSGGVKNVKIDNCNFIGTDVGLRFKSTRGRGGVVENIYISNIFMKDIPTEALSFNMYYGGFAPTEDKSAEEKSQSAIPVEVSEETPVFRNIFMENIYCDGAEDAVIFQGLPEMPIANMVLKNSVMKAKRGVSIYDADGIKLINTKMLAEEPVVKIVQSKNILLENFETDFDLNTLVKVEGSKTKDIVMQGDNASVLKSKTQFGNDISENVLIVK